MTNRMVSNFEALVKSIIENKENQKIVALGGYMATCGIFITNQEEKEAVERCSKQLDEKNYNFEQRDVDILTAFVLDCIEYSKKI